MSKSSEKQRSGWFAKGGVLASLFAVVGASCCILPIILINLGLSSALVSHLGFFARFRHWFMVALSIMLIIGGIVYAYSGGRRPKRRTLVIFVLAAILILAAYILPYYEGDLQRWLNLTSR